jgi:hypothetical protein
VGRKNFDRWPPEAWRRSAENVARMRAKGWTVLAYCPVCQLTMAVDLGLIERLRGPEFSLWNRQAPCRRLGCAGRVEFQGKPPEVLSPFPLRASWVA